MNNESNRDKTKVIREENLEKSLTKHEWKKHEKVLYAPQDQPQLVHVERQKYFMIKGIGNPNDEDFSERIGVLYALAYAVRMMPKSGVRVEGYYTYTVYPLEGVWEAVDASAPMEKNSLSYTLMIRQPDFVTEEVARRAIEIVQKKKPHLLLKEAYFGEWEDGLSLQILHTGSYDSEPLSFKKMKAFMKQQNLERTTTIHREIYLSDARKVQREKLKTILRYNVRHMF